MYTIHVENTVRDFDAWKAVFDKFDRLRADRGVLGHRICRDPADGNRVTVELEFATRSDAGAFRDVLHQIVQTPQSRQHLVDHTAFAIREVVEQLDIAGCANKVASITREDS